MPVPRDYQVKLYDKPVVVIATVFYDHGVHCEVHSIRVDGTPHEIDFKHLASGTQTRLKKDLALAEMLRADIGGSTYCPHNKYLIEEPCAACLAAAKATP